MLISTDIYANKCACGWYFPALSSSVAKCPECRSVIQRCICCGNEIEGIVTIRYCEKCAKDVKKIEDKYRMRDRRSMRDMTMENKICDYDCFNCQYSDCIHPADDIQEELF